MVSDRTLSGEVFDRSVIRDGITNGHLQVEVLPWIVTVMLISFSALVVVV